MKKQPRWTRGIPAKTGSYLFVEYYPDSNEILTEPFVGDFNARRMEIVLGNGSEESVWDRDTLGEMQETLAFFGPIPDPTGKVS